MYRALVSDLYRLVHGRMLWISLAVLAALLVGAMGFLWWGTSDQFREMFGEQAAAEGAAIASGSTAGSTDGSSSGGNGLQITIGPGTATDPESKNAVERQWEADDSARIMQSRTYVYASLLTSGGFLSAAASIVAVLLCADDRSGGFVKTLFAGGRGRPSFFAARVVTVAVLCALLYGVGIVLSDLVLPLLGFSYRTVDPAPDWWAYVGLGMLGTTCYALLSTAFAQVTRSKAAGVAFAVIVCSGMAGSLAASAIGLFANGLPFVADLLTWLPSSCLSLMTGGAGALSAMGEVAGLAAPVHVALCFALWTAVGAVVTVAAGSLRDLA